MIKIAIIGGPSSGKTSLARQLTTKLYNELNKNCRHVEEFARSYIDECNMHGKFQPRLSDQQLIFDNQVKRELSVPSAVEYMISDSPVFLPLIFTYNLIRPEIYPERAVYSYLYNEFLHKYLNYYNYVFFVSREKPFLKDGTRNESEEDAKLLDGQILAFLVLHKIQYHKISGQDDDRIKKVLEILNIKEQK